MRTGIKRYAALLLPLVLLVVMTLLHRQEEQPAGGYLLYFLSDLEQSGGGDALMGVDMDLELPEGASAVEKAAAIIQHLIAGVGGQGSPFPEGTELQSISIRGQRAYVDFNARYASLTGIDLSLADYCVTLSLTQLEEISAVSITANGREITYRDNQVLMEGDVLLSNMEDVIESVAAVLYFVNEEGELASENRVLELYEGDTLAEELLSALLEGPQEQDRYPIIPEEFVITAVWVEDRTCYLSLPQQSIDSLPEKTVWQERILESIAYSIYDSIDTVDEIRILVGGKEVTDFGKVPVESVSIRPDEAVT